MNNAETIARILEHAEWLVLEPIRCAMTRELTLSELDSLSIALEFLMGLGAADPGDNRRTLADIQAIIARANEGPE